MTTEKMDVAILGGGNAGMGRDRTGSSRRSLPDLFGGHQAHARACVIGARIAGCYRLESQSAFPQGGVFNDAVDQAGQTTRFFQEEIKACSGKRQMQVFAAEVSLWPSPSRGR
jgi:hypothetical protein